MTQLLDDPEFRMQIAAYLYSKGIDQKGIVERLNISQSQVSRLLKKAVEQRLLIRRFEFNQRLLSKERYQRIKEETEIPLELFDNIRKLSECVTTVRIFDSGSSDETYAERLIPFARSASNYLQDLLEEVNVIGVTWGNTLSSLVESLEKKHTSSYHNKPKIFVPLCGELTSTASRQYHSTMIAERLNEIINKGEGEHLSLTGIPAFIPTHLNDNKLDEREIELLHKFVKSSKNYQAIFEKPIEGSYEEMPYIDRLECILTSIGPINMPLGQSIIELVKVSSYIYGERTGISSYSSAGILSAIIGDIGGVLLKNPNQSQGAIDTDQIEKKWTGIHFDQMQNLAKRAMKSAKVKGVVVFAHGKNKAPVLIEAIRQGLVNQVIIDFELAEALSFHLRNLQ